MCFLCIRDLVLGLILLFFDLFWHDAILILGWFNRDFGLLVLLLLVLCLLKWLSFILLLRLACRSKFILARNLLSRLFRLVISLLCSSIFVCIVLGRCGRFSLFTHRNLKFLPYKIINEFLLLFLLVVSASALCSSLLRTFLLLYFLRFVLLYVICLLLTL
jgi:hypothetical protein